MKNLKLIFYAFLPIQYLWFSCGAQVSADNKIRKAMVAGSFYAANPQELALTVDQLIDDAINPKIQETIVGLISPHAGYVFSGPVAAAAYAQLKGREIQRVIVISPSHVDAFEGISVYDGEAYETPLGKIAVDKKFAKDLAAQSGAFRLSSRGHDRIYQGRGEHALEVQLPFLQRVLKEFTLVPVVMGEQSYETCRALGKALSKLIKDEKTIMVASSDLSHFHSYTEARQLDSKIIKAVQEWDYFNLSRNLQSQNWEACGGGPIVSLMIAAEALGATEARLLKQANSGDIPMGDKSRVVGYASFAFIKSTTQKNKGDGAIQFNKKEQKELLNIAKSAVEKYITENEVFEPGEKNENLWQNRGAFVTLKINGQLRGCIGYTSPLKPLCQTVRDVAIQAATQDPRFRPVSEKELSLLTYEISVLSPFTKVVDTERIELGKHGLLIKKGAKAGLLLPQVPVEQGWDRLTFLQQTCFKAGLEADAWRDSETDIFQFSAFVFGDHD